MIKVMKFGGTSVGSVDALELAATIIKREEAKKAVVVSAMSGVTNSLIACLRDRPQVEEFLAGLRTKYSCCAKILMPDAVYAEYLKELEDSVGRLGTMLNKRYCTCSDPLADDMISSWGERLSSLTVAFVLKGKGVNAVPMSSEISGIVAEGMPGNGSADLEATFNNLKKNISSIDRRGYRTCAHWLLRL